MQPYSFLITQEIANDLIAAYFPFAVSKLKNSVYTRFLSLFGQFRLGKWVNKLVIQLKRISCFIIVFAGPSFSNCWKFTWCNNTVILGTSAVVNRLIYYIFQSTSRFAESFSMTKLNWCLCSFMHFQNLLLFILSSSNIHVTSHFCAAICMVFC